MEEEETEDCHRQEREMPRGSLQDQRKASKFGCVWGKTTLIPASAIRDMGLQLPHLLDLLLLLLPVTH